MDRCTLVRRLEAIDLATADLAGVLGVLRAAVELEAFAASIRSSAAVALRRLHAAGEGPRPETVIGGLLGRAESNRVLRRTELLERTPAMDVALRAGAITPAHVDALAGAVKNHPDLVDLQIEIAQAAARMSPDRFGEHVRRLAAQLAEDGGISVFERQRRQTQARMWTDAEGMYQLHARLDPERGSQLLAALSADVERQHRSGEGDGLDHPRRMAIALHRLVTGSGAGAAMEVTMNVHIDEHTLREGLHEHTLLDIDGGGILPVETLRRLACEAEIRPMVFGSDGVVRDIGRKQRLATSDQRAALRGMHRTCGVPGCDVPYRNCEIHHIQWWRRMGRTDLDNMIPLCSRHHHDVHEGGWNLAMDTMRNISWGRPPPTSVAA